MTLIEQNKDVPEEYPGKWRSIEFELIFNGENDLNAFIEFIEINQYQKFVTIKSDDSIVENEIGNITKEIIVSFCVGKKDEKLNPAYPRSKIVYDVCKFLKGRASVNHSCGTHVHFDMRGIPVDKVEEYGSRLARAVPALRLLTPKARRNNYNCHDTINSMSSDENNDEHSFAFGYKDDRYTFVNMKAYNDHKTIEVRGHSGTLSAKKILNWIKICEKILSRKPPKDKLHFYSPLELIEYYKIDGELADFIRQRNEELNPKREAKIMEIEG